MTDEDEGVEVKVAAWRMATQDNISQREIATRLGISKSTVNRYVAEGRIAEVYVLAFAKAELRQDVAYRLRWMIGHWVARLAGKAEELALKDELAISDHLAKLLAQFTVLMGLAEPVRVALGPDGAGAKTPEPALLQAMEEAQRDNADYLARIKAGQVGWPNTDEETA